ncbi:MAG: hypothetical protein IKP43_04380 [Bacteroidaceae bacterium]|jgi:hypothetical protein|nr:hypothetical protein [Bacteroidaceae bacterium]
MKKNTWIKPEFEVETFVPNNYIALCSLTIEHSNLQGYVIVDVNNNGKYDGSGVFDNEGNPLTPEALLTTGTDNLWFNNLSAPQTLPTPSENITVESGKFTYVNNAVLLTEGNGKDFVSYTAVTMDIEGEKNMVFYTPNTASNNS